MQISRNQFDRILEPGDLAYYDGQVIVITEVQTNYILARKYGYSDTLMHIFGLVGQCTIITYRAIQSAYDRHSQFLHGMMAGAVLALMVMWTAYQVTHGH